MLLPEMLHELGSLPQPASVPDRLWPKLNSDVVHMGVGF